jgi:hypothetical protein
MVEPQDLRFISPAANEEIKEAGATLINKFFDIEEQYYTMTYAAGMHTLQNAYLNEMPLHAETLREELLSQMTDVMAEIIKKINMDDLAQKMNILIEAEPAGRLLI